MLTFLPGFKEEGPGDSWPLHTLEGASTLQLLVQLQRPLMERFGESQGPQKFHPAWNSCLVSPLPPLCLCCSHVAAVSLGISQTTSGPTIAKMSPGERGPLAGYRYRWGFGLL